MYIHPVVLVLIVLLYAYLIGVNVHLHRRVKKLEMTVSKLEGMNGGGTPKPRWEKKEDLS